MIIIFLINLTILVFGLAIGSFLNVVIYRLEKNKELTGRSFCPSCKHKLSWIDLFPVFSFLFLRGKCRYCYKKISWQYPLIEILTALVFLLIFNFQFSIFNQFNFFDFIEILFLFYIASTLIIIFLYDLKHYIIPDQILFPAIIISFIYRFVDLFRIENFSSFYVSVFGQILNFGNYVLAAILAAGFFLFIYLISNGKWMGFGDVKLAILLGIILGIKNVLLAIFLAFFFGAIIGVGLIIQDRKELNKLKSQRSFKKQSKNNLPIGLKSQIPFAPFLIIGTFTAMFFGEKLINWYIKFLY